MLRFLSIMLFASLAVVSLPSAAASQTPGWWGVRGGVVDGGAEGNVPLAGVTVTITDSSGMSKGGTVGTSGGFALSLLAATGESEVITVSAIAPTFLPFSESFEVDVGSEVNVAIRLERAPGYEPTPSIGPDREPQLTDQIRRLYFATFGRDADADGLAFWIEQRAQGATLAATAEGFARSPEFVATYGSLDDAAFVERLYLEVLNRPSDPEGAAGWVANLAAGMRRGDVLAHFSDSPEFVEITDTAAPFPSDVAQLVRLYLATLKRLPDQPGLNQFHLELRSGTSVVTIAQGLVDSEEFLRRYRPQDFIQGLGGPATLDNQSYVVALYWNVLGRAPEPEGLAAWTGLLDAGMSRGQLALHFADSAEFIRTSNTIPLR